MVPQFSFPGGLSSTNVLRVGTELEMNQVVFVPLSSVEESNSSFVFLLTMEESLLYGVCVTHDELLRVRQLCSLSLSLSLSLRISLSPDLSPLSPNLSLSLQLSLPFSLP